MSAAFVTYPYASGDLLERRNTYQYSAFAGVDFLHAWRAERNAVRTRLPQPLVAPAAAGFAERPVVEHGVVTAALLEWLFAVYAGPASAATRPPAQALLARIVQRFEVSKRVHSAYTPAWRPADPNAYHDLTLYLRLAEVLAAACADPDLESLPLLNALLKVVDTLCAERHRLDRGLGARLAGVIEREHALVRALAESVEVRAW